MTVKEEIDISTFIGIGFLTFGAIVLEISLTRLFSVSQGYHFAFLIVSIALLGIGAGGSFLMAFGERVKEPSRVLPAVAFLFSVTTIISYIAVNTIPFDLERIAVDFRQPFFLFLTYFVLSVPFFFSGLAVAFIISKAPQSSGRILFADLLGAGIGGVFALLFLSIGGGKTGVIAAALFGGCGAVFFSKGRMTFILWAAFMVILLAYPPTFLNVNISPYKELSQALRYPNSSAETFYNSVSRIDLVKSGAVRTAPGISLKYLEKLPPQVGITIDGEGLIAVTKGDGMSNDWKFVEYLPSSLPYYLKEKLHEKLNKKTKVLLLYHGGGMEVAKALKFGAEKITVIEKNPLVIKVIGDNLKTFTNGLLKNERVNLKIGTPRELLPGEEELYDLIVISGPTTLGASSSGTGGIGENYDLTMEAMSLYLSRLKPNGYITATKYLIPPPREELKLIATMAAALKTAGFSPTNSTLAIRSWGTLTYIVKKGDISENEIEITKKFSEKRSFDTVYFPGISESDINKYNVFSDPIYEEFIAKILMSPQILKSPQKEPPSNLFTNYLFDITPPTDNKPFYYKFFKDNRVKETYLAVDKKWPILLKGGYLVWVVVFQGLLLSIVLIIFPVLIRNRGINRDDLISLYPFLAVGLAFIFLEIGLIKRFILFLGEPTLAVSAAISSILVSAGVGSFVSGRIRGISLKSLLVTALIILSVLILIYRLFVTDILNLLITLPTIAKYPVAALIIAPLGFIMGFVFPTLIREIEDRGKGDLIPWAWCVNGTASVVGAPLSVICALSVGFSGVMVAASLLYISALPFLVRSIGSKEIV
jgi:hypothetical protein